MTEEIPVNRKPFYAIAAALSVSMPGTLFGQDVGPYDPLGIRAGAFRIFPTTDVSVSYDDNVDATKNDTRDDFVAVMAPSVEVQSDFSRHAVGFTVFSEVGRFFQETKEDYWDFGITGNGRLDITRDNNVDGNFTVAREHDARDDPEDDGPTSRRAKPCFSATADVPTGASCTTWTARGLPPPIRAGRTGGRCATGSTRRVYS
jgi:hypothetical protein